MAETVAVTVVTPFYLDKAVWAMVLTPIFVLLNAKFGLALDPLAIIGLVLPVVAFILGHKWKTGTLQSAAIAAGAAAAKDPGPVING